MEVRLPEHAARLVPRKAERTPAGAGGSLSGCFLKFTSISSLFLWPLPTPLWSWTQPQGPSVVKWHLPAAQRGPQINTQSRALFTFEQEKQAGDMRMHTSASFCCRLSPYLFLLSLSFMNAPRGARSCPHRCWSPECLFWKNTKCTQSLPDSEYIWVWSKTIQTREHLSTWKIHCWYNGRGVQNCLQIIN